VLPHYSYKVFWYEPDQCYFAVVPDVPELEYVSAFGDSPEEALAELQTALSGIAEMYREEGREMPAPHGEAAPA
jgi:predicted RNase H-like HicB family nuclease